MPVLFGIDKYGYNHKLKFLDIYGSSKPSLFLNQLLTLKGYHYTFGIDKLWVWSNAIFSIALHLPTLA
jgi:hypothetical protein